MRINVKIGLLWLCLLPIGLFAEEKLMVQTIRGIVIDKLNEMPIPGANIIIPGSDPLIGTVSDADGQFEITNVPVGRVDIQVTFMGYHSMDLYKQNLISGKELYLRIELEEEIITGQEIVIKAHSRKDQAINKMASVSARSFTVEETQKYAGSLGDPSRMASNFAGVLSVSDQRNDIVIRGNSPSGVLWRLDGFDIPNPNHFGSMGSTGGPVSMLNNNQLANSDFFTGAFPAEYGNALAGAFDLRMRNGNNYKREHVFQVGFNGFELGTEGPLGKEGAASYIINYRYSTLAIFNLMGIDMGLGSSIPQYQDLSFKINLPSTKTGNWQLIGLGGLSFIEMDSREQDSTDWTYGLNDTYSRFGSDMGVIGLSNTYYFNPNTRLVSKVSYQTYKYTGKIDSVLIDESTEAFYRNVFSESKWTLQTQLKKKFSARNNSQIGIQYELSNVDYSDKYYDTDFGKFIDRVNIKGEMGFFRAFAQHQHKFTDDLKLTAGINYQYLPFNNSQSVEPRTGLKWQFRPQHSLNLGYGLHSQSHSKNIYFLETHIEQNDTYIRTNEDLDFTKSQHFVLGYDWLIAPNLRLKAEAYYQKLWNVPVSDSLEQFSMLNTGDFFTIPLQDYLENRGKGKNYGVELTIEKFLSNGYYFLWTTSLFESKYTGADDIWRNTSFNGNYVTNALIGYEHKFNNKFTLEVNLKAIYAGGKRKLPIDVNASIAEEEMKFDWNNAYEEKFSDYYKIDGRISFNLNSGKYNQEWAIDFQNLTNNTSNVLMDSWDNETQAIRTEYQSGLFPMFLYRVYF